MRCDLCNGNRFIIIGVLEFKSRPLGKILVPNIRHSKCSSCGDINIDYNETKKVNSFIEAKENEAIRSLPVGEFVSLNEAAKILDKTKQAFSKDSRIKRGFIYHIVIDNKKLYFKKSVEEFKRNGKDGRILLSNYLNGGQKLYLYTKTKQKPKLTQFLREVYSRPTIVGIKSQEGTFVSCLHKIELNNYSIPATFKINHQFGNALSFDSNEGNDFFPTSIGWNFQKAEESIAWVANKR